MKITNYINIVSLFKEFKEKAQLFYVQTKKINLTCFKKFKRKY